MRVSIAIPRGLSQSTFVKALGTQFFLCELIIEKEYSDFFQQATSSLPVQGKENQ